MVTYWLMFLLPAFAAFKGAWRRPSAATGLRSLRLTMAWTLVIVALASLIGFRFRVGGDWGNYLRVLRGVEGREISEVLVMGDPGYQLLSWISLEAGWGIYGVNLIGGTLFTIGLAFFCRSLPRPWLALVVAVPYMVIVVGMGYTRQAIALGLAMMGLVALGRRSILWFVFWVMLGATFHKSAVLLLPIAALASTRNRYWTILWVGVVSLGAYRLMLEQSVEQLYAGYIDAGLESQGALIRTVMNALPASIFLIWRSRFLLNEAEGSLWGWFSLISLALLVLLLLTPSSTAVDRIGLYMLPLQLVVFSHLPDVFGRPTRRNIYWVTAVVLYYAAVQFVWLNFAVHAHAWLPYRFYPLETI